MTSAIKLIYNLPPLKVKKVKEHIVPREIHLRTTGCHLSMGSHSVICHPTEVIAPPSPQPGQVGTRFIDITQKWKSCCIPLSSMNGSEKNRFWCVWSGCEPAVWLDHSRCLKWRPFAFTHARSRVCHWSMASSTMPWGSQSQVSMSLCFSSSTPCFGFV